MRGSSPGLSATGCTLLDADRGHGSGSGRFVAARQFESQPRRDLVSGLREATDRLGTQSRLQGLVEQIRKPVAWIGFEGRCERDPGERTVAAHVSAEADKRGGIGPLGDRAGPGRARSTDAPPAVRAVRSQVPWRRRAPCGWRAGRPARRCRTRWDPFRRRTSRCVRARFRVRDGRRVRRRPRGHSVRTRGRGSRRPRRYTARLPASPPADTARAVRRARCGSRGSGCPRTPGPPRPPRTRDRPRCR